MGRNRSPSPDDIPLRDYVEVRLSEIDKRYAERFAAQERAGELLQRENLEWRKQANEWRGAMSDRDRELPSRREVEALFSGLTDRFEVAYSSLSDRVRKLESQAEAAVGRREGVNVSAGVLAGAIAAVGGVLAIIIVVVNLWTG